MVQTGRAICQQTGVIAFLSDKTAIFSTTWNSHGNHQWTSGPLIIISFFVHACATCDVGSLEGCRRLFSMIQQVVQLPAYAVWQDLHFNLS